MSAMPVTLEIEMDCIRCGRYSTSVVCPACAGKEHVTPSGLAPLDLARHDPVFATPPLDAAPDSSASETMLDLETGGAVEPPSEFGAAPEELAPVDTTLVQELTAIATAGAANAAVRGSGSMAGGQLRGVGYSSADGYVTAIRNGVVPRTHAHYLAVLRQSYGYTDEQIAALPGAQTMADLPTSLNPIVHDGIIPTKATLKPFVVGPAPAEQQGAIRTTISSTELVAGAVAEGHHSIVAWEGTSQTTRGAIVEALTAIGRQSWAPRAPKARAQAGSAIAALSRNGLDVRAATKATAGTELSTGEHVWTVGRVSHTGSIGDHYGDVRCRFRLAGDVLSYTGDDSIGAPVVAAYAARMAAETLKSGDVTSWLAATIRTELRGVRFGALGWLVPAVHVDTARQVCNAIAGAGFGTGWVDGLPVATSDQLRNGIVRGLTDEVATILERLASERAAAAAERQAAIDAATTGEAVNKANNLSGDIGTKRIETFLRDLRAVAGRIVAYGQVLGEERVAKARDAVAAANTELETLNGGDYQGISARFSAVWEEIEHDARLKGDVL